MTRDLLEAAGEALFGPRWHAALCDALGVGDRTMRRWIAGEFEIPAGVTAEIRALLEQRGLEIAGIIARLPRQD